MEDLNWAYEAGAILEENPNISGKVIEAVFEVGDSIKFRKNPGKS